jgi:predicted NodU family carbamoyl transferase
MATIEAAREWFDLPVGTAADSYDALAYMAVAVKAKRKALGVIPAVLNHDGTARLQIVRPADNPLAHCILRSLGARNGVEIALNTSLNVQTPIVGSVEQAVGALKRSSGLDGLVVVVEEGPAFLMWHNVIGEFKDAGSRLIRAVKEFDRVSR